MYILLDVLQTLWWAARKFQILLLVNLMPMSYIKGQIMIHVRIPTGGMDPVLNITKEIFLSLGTKAPE